MRSLIGLLLLLVFACVGTGASQDQVPPPNLGLSSSGGGGGGGSPTGAAGGDLGGTYPNPTVLNVTDVTTGIIKPANGGTGGGSAQAGFDNISPLNLIGDMIYYGIGATNARLAGNTSATTYVLTSTGNGSVAAAPVWMNPSAITAGTVTTNANLTGPITSTGNATAVASQTGTGSKFVMDTNPVLVTPNLGTPSAAVLTNATGTAAGLTAGNASQLLSATWASPAAIGTGTPAAITGTSVTSTVSSAAGNGFVHQQTVAGALGSLFYNPSSGSTSYYAINVWSDDAAFTLAAYSTAYGSPLTKAAYLGNTGTGPMIMGAASGADMEIYASHRVSIGSNVDNTRDKLQVSGCATSTGISPGYVTKSSAYTATNTDFFIAVTATPVTITLPTTGMTTGHVFVVCPTVATPTITISATVNGAANPTLTTQYVPGRYIWNGTNYTSW